MMKLLTLGKIALSLVCVCSIQLANAQTCTNLIWSDEFNGTSLDNTSWTPSTGNGCGGSSGCGYGNGEKEYYTSDNISFDGSNLVITAKNQNNYLNSGSDYSSAKITTSGKRSFRYGRVEARIKTPSAAAIWPAFWLLPEGGLWPHTGEIDIMEMQNANPAYVDQTLHYFCTPCGNHQNTGNRYKPTAPAVNFSSAFHIYGVEWSPGKIVYTIDGTAVKTFTPASFTAANGSIFTDWAYDDGNWFVILNLAVGGSYTGNATPVPANYPVSMLVDYVRIYSTPSTLGVIGPDIIFNGTQGTYNASTIGVGVSPGTAVTYNWTVTGGNVASGQGTSKAVINWTSAGNQKVTVSADLDNTGTGCTATSIDYPVTIVDKTCGIVLDNYESTRNISDLSFNNGTYTSPFANPLTTGSNTSAFCGRYVRSAGQQYDLIRIDKFLAGSPADFRTGKMKFTMDLMSTAPAGTPITIEFDKSTDPGYPQGVHSQYTAVTGAPNVWSKVTFTFSTSPKASLTDADVDRIQILFNPNTTTNHTYYIDNFTAQQTSGCTTPVTDAQLKAQIAEVYPNPFSGNMNIKIHTEDASSVNIHIFDNKGALVLSSEDVDSDSVFEIGKELPVGLYLVRISNKDIVYTTKVIKEN